MFKYEMNSTMQQQVETHAMERSCNKPSLLFHNLSKSHVSTLTLLITALFISIVDLPLSVIQLAHAIHSHIHTNYPAIIFLSIHSLCAFLSAGASWALVIKQIRSYLSISMEAATNDNPLAMLFCICITLSNIFSLLWYIENFHDSDLSTPFNTIQSDKSNAIFPAFPTIFVMFTPILLSVLFHDANRVYLLYLWIMCLVTLVAAAVLRDTKESIGSLLAYFIYSALILLFIFQRDQPHQMIRADSHLNVQPSHSQRRQQHESEMRHMVANVAHDLKTPLSSFMTGIDIVAELLSESRLLINNNTLDLTFIAEMVSTTEACMRNIRNTNCFMVMTINRILDYTKACQGMKLVPRLETINLLDALALPLTCMKDIQSSMEIELESICPSICSHIITDKQWLQENLLCLLSNAVKYSAAGKISIAVSLENAEVEQHQSEEVVAAKATLLVSPNRFISRVTPSRLPLALDIGQKASSASPVVCDQMLRFEIEDQGIGMSAEAMATLFSAFQQNQRLAGGTGLGLFSLGKRVTSLHGRCGVMRRRDEQLGSRFWFTIPYRADQLAANYRSDSASIYAGGSAFLKVESPRQASGTFPLVRRSPKVGDEAKKGSILIVDDAPTVTKMTAMMLTRHEYEVTRAENGAIGLEIIQQQLLKHAVDGVATKCAFDIILMDLQMPVMDGLEATKRLRAWEAKQITSNGVKLAATMLRHVVIGVSANCDEEVVLETRSIGFSGFISKPFAIAAFYEELHRIHSAVS